MRILITGAGGFIGSHLAKHLHAQGHTIIAGARNPTRWQAVLPMYNWITVDFMRNLQVEVWLPRLLDVDLVINTVGIIAEHGTQSFDQVQTLAPQALFSACAQRGIKVIQISALGADDPTQGTRFLHSKRLADDWLRRLDCESLILYPSIVIGRGGASTALFEQLSALPVIPVLGAGQQRINPIHIEDLCWVITHMVDHWPPGRQQHQLAGPQVLSLIEFHRLLRRRLGMGKARFVHLPLSLVRPLIRLMRPLQLRVAINEETLTLLSESRTPAPTYTEVPIRPIAQALAQDPVTRAEIWGLQFANLRPALFISIAFIWIFTGLTSAIFDLPSGYALLRAGGIEGELATISIYAGALLDLILGLLMVFNIQRRSVYLLQIGLMLGYMALATVIVPAQWLYPLGPLTKNLPLIIATGLLWATEPRR